MSKQSIEFSFQSRYRLVDGIIPCIPNSPLTHTERLFQICRKVCHKSIANSRIRVGKHDGLQR